MFESVQGELIGGQDDCLFLKVGSFVISLRTTLSLAGTLLQNIPCQQEFYLAMDFPAGGTPSLIAFSERSVRELYLALLGINGVGVETALKALNGVEPLDLLRAVAGKDFRFLTSLPGIGQKRAEILVKQMKKVVLPKAIDVTMNTWITAREGLMQEGYAMHEAEMAMMIVVHEKIKPEQLIKDAKKHL